MRAAIDFADAPALATSVMTYYILLKVTNCEGAEAMARSGA
jgi:hypothetical protein